MEVLKMLGYGIGGLLLVALFSVAITDCNDCEKRGGAYVETLGGGFKCVDVK